MIILKHSFITVVAVIVINILINILSLEQNSTSGFVISTLFLVTWLLNGTIQRKSNAYVLFIALYPIVGILLGLLFKFYPISALAAVLQFLYVKPMGGYYFLIHYFYNQKILVEYLILFLLPSTFGLLGYIMKKVVIFKRLYKITNTSD
ncbi:hypothetical protein FE783_35650 [Paenibacillus mesophilus]|uniref:hypothetical protein n=1 Tax=Paenibacillus mesophilus TaxID=2582849 RepID=UPI00110D70E9|nr:hypothetical protein [Paenibacillus mesophilus]TMV43304.1 hypothetical protein FE783_35650 [Paenibacillus mesophilus]